MKNQISFFLFGTMFIALILFGFTKVLPDEPAHVTVVETVNITGTRFLFPLIEKWGEEFTKEHPGIKINVEFGHKQPDINATATPITQKDSSKGEYTTVSRFALVPITNANNPALNDFEEKGISKKDFLEIYFGSSNSAKSFRLKTNKEVPINVYSRGACASATFTNQFGKKIKDMNNVGGAIEDDAVLLEKVKGDSLAIAYNNLGFVYDLESRTQKSGIRVIPIDINSNGKIDPEENVYQNLDQLISYIEKNNKDLPPTGDVTFIHKRENQAAETFIKWILSKGYTYNNEYGFLQLKN